MDFDTWLRVLVERLFDEVKQPFAVILPGGLAETFGVMGNPTIFVVNLPRKARQASVTLPDEPQYHAPPPCKEPDEPSFLSVRVFSSRPSP